MQSKGKKYPRSLHFSWTGHMTTDDKKWTQDQVDEQFIGREVVVSAKIDGECTTFTQEICHARSPESRNHPSRTLVKALHARIKHEIPDKWRICGENMVAEHSIHYHELTAYFYVFTIFNENDVGLCWDETVGYASMLGLQTVPVLYRGVWDESKVKSMMLGTPVFGGVDIVTKVPALEGYVARLTSEIQIGYSNDEDENSREILLGVGKCVRRNHVKSDFQLREGQHWLNKPLVMNDLKEGIHL